MARRRWVVALGVSALVAGGLALAGPAQAQPAAEHGPDWLAWIPDRVVDVTTTEDIEGSGVLSLRDALAIASTDGEATAVRLAPGAEYRLSAGICTLLHESPDPLVLLGDPGAPATIVQTCPDTRVLTGGPGVIDLRSVVLTGGSAGFAGVGGAVAVSGPLRTWNTTLRGNSAMLGGALVASGSVELVDTDLAGNSAMLGGAMAVSGSLGLEGTSVQGNEALVGGGIVATGTVVVFNGDIHDNQALVGGGIAAAGEVLVQDSTVRANKAMAGGGVVAVGSIGMDRSVVADNVAEAGPAGGLGSSSNVRLDEVTVSGNTAVGVGAGVQSAGGVILSYSTVSDNELTVPALPLEPPMADLVEAAGIRLDTADAVRAAAARAKGDVGEDDDEGEEEDDEFGAGAGIQAAGTVSVVLSTVSGNRAGEGVGGGIAAGGDVNVIASTVLGNEAAVASNVMAVGWLTANAAVVARGVTGPSCQVGYLAPASSGNFADDASCGWAAGGDPMLGPLADNGGPTLTHLPQPGSPLIGTYTGDVTWGDMDQRLWIVPEGATRDIGSVQTTATPPTGPEPPNQPDAGA